jgi:hypothetical protein
MRIVSSKDCSFGRDPAAALSFLLAALGQVVVIFIFLKKENKGCRFLPHANHNKRRLFFQ